MDINDLRSAVTLLGLLLFAGLLWWTWRPAQREAFDAAARLPLDGDAHEQGDAR